MKYQFDDIFDEKNGQLTPKVPIRVGGVQLGPGVSFSSGVTISGVNLYDYKKAAIEAQQENGHLAIKGFYVKDNE